MKSWLKWMLTAGAVLTVAGLVIACAAWGRGGRPVSIYMENGKFVVEERPGLRMGFFGGGDGAADKAKDPVAGSEHTPAGEVKKLRLEADVWGVQIGEGGSELTKPVLQIWPQEYSTVDLAYSESEQEWTIKLGCKEDDRVQVNREGAAAVLLLPPGTVLDELDIECRVGAVELENVKANKSDISCEVGSVSGSADLPGKNGISCNVGSVELKLKRPADWGYEVDGSLTGSVKIDGGSVSDGDVKNESAPAFYDIECQVGSVKLKFE